MLDPISLNYYCRVLSDRQNNITVDFEFNLLEDLYSEKHSPLYEEGKDEYKSIWIRLKNPSYEEFKQEYNKNYESDEDEIRCEYEINYYDEPYSYYEVTFVKTTNGYYGLFINNNVLLTHDSYGLRENKCWFLSDDEMKKFIADLDNLCKESVELIRSDKYQELLDGIPYRFKTGTVKQKDIEKVFFEGKPEYDFENKEKFLAICEKENVEEVQYRLKSMTAQLFFDACKAGYDENAYETSGLSSKECYDKFADGRDEGLKEIDETSEDAFEIWYNDKTRFGGHPWEVARGGNSTHVDLYVIHDKGGYYFDVSGKSSIRCVEAINFFIAIKRMGIPVCLGSGKKLEKRMRGEETVGIVPHGIIPRYCEGRFPGEDIISFMNIYAEEEAIVPYVKWKSFNIPEVKEC